MFKSYEKVRGKKKDLLAYLDFKSYTNMNEHPIHSQVSTKLPHVSPPPRPTLPRKLGRPQRPAQPCLHLLYRAFPLNT
jgi:hypothetical protein